jgi:hypothetical protein
MVFGYNGNIFSIQNTFCFSVFPGSQKEQWMEKSVSRLMLLARAVSVELAGTIALPRAQPHDEH